MHNLLLLFVLLYGTSACALQTKFIPSNGTVWAEISTEHSTRIFVEGERIKKYYSGLDNFFVDKNEEQGELLIKPKRDQKVELFVVTEKGQVANLILNPKKMHADHIQIHIANSSRKNAKELLGGATPLSDAVIELVRDMYANKEPEGIQVIKHTLKFSSKQGLNIHQTHKYLAKDLTGVILVAQNTTNKTIHLAPFLLKKEGVLAIAIENKQLRPKQKTTIFQVETAHV